jgi:hypothetical protein
MKRLTPYLAALGFMAGMALQACRENHTPTPSPTVVCTTDHGVKYCQQPPSKEAGK